jgi:hypothetical protein
MYRAALRMRNVLSNAAQLNPDRAVGDWTRTFTNARLEWDDAVTVYHTQVAEARKSLKKIRAAKRGKASKRA